MSIYTVIMKISQSEMQPSILTLMKLSMCRCVYVQGEVSAGVALYIISLSDSRFQHVWFVCVDAT